MSDPKNKPSLFSRKIFLGTTIAGALFFMLLGALFWGGLNLVMEDTSTLAFCISCHEMEDNLYAEYKNTVHYRNHSGVRAICSDCHIPDPILHKMVRKAEASREVLGKIMGTIDTPEKFEQLRMEMAGRVWDTMESTDSRECRKCHDFAAMESTAQSDAARHRHQRAKKNNKTCIDCHKGIAHNLPKQFIEDEHERFALEETPCDDCHIDLDF